MGGDHRVTLAGVLAVATSLPHVAVGVDTLLGVTRHSECEVQVLTSVVEASDRCVPVAAVAYLSIATWALVLGAGILARFEWARDAAIVTHVAFALVAAMAATEAYGVGLVAGVNATATALGSSLVAVTLTTAAAHDEFDRRGFHRRSRRRARRRERTSAQPPRRLARP